jgi:methionyl aminopeptidase
MKRNREDTLNPLSPAEIKSMEKAGRLAAECLQYVGSFVKAGVFTEELDRIAHEFTLSKGAVPAPLGYQGFPKSICTSVNHCVCHGVPGKELLKDGDIINIDVTCIVEGFHGDTSSMFFVGEVSEKAQDICKVAFEAMHKGIEQVSPFTTTGDIGFAVNKFVTRKGYFPVKDIGGHGIGRIFHGDPFVPSYGKKGKGDRLKPWCCITVEPMINATDAELVEYDIPGSAIKYYETADQSLSAQYEHTVLITDTGHEILTRLD